MSSDVESAAARVERLRGRLSAIAMVAREASRLRPPGTPTGERWHWECSHCDTPIPIDPLVDEYVRCPSCSGWGVSLRSVEEYREPGDRCGLSAHIVSGADEVPALAGLHLATFDPAAVLGLVEALLAIAGLHAPDSGGTRCDACADVDTSGGWRAERWPCRTLVALLGIDL